MRKAEARKEAIRKEAELKEELELQKMKELE